jgi:hypothetical protein
MPIDWSDFLSEEGLFDARVGLSAPIRGKQEIQSD